MKNTLVKQTCEVCHSDTQAISKNELALLLKEIPGWTEKIKNNVMVLERTYSFKNYKLAWAFSNEVSELAEKEGHHPAILLEWGKVTITWWTHTINGLHQNDFICAAKTSQLIK